MIVLALAAATYRWIAQLDARSTYRPRELALLGQVPFLAPLAPYELENLAQVSQWRRVPTGTRVVIQGEPGDAYYLVSEGRLSVTVDGRLRDHEIGPGQGFGEIALLRGSARTATVTAVTDCELLMLRSEAFLGAVASSAPSGHLAEETGRRLLDADRAIDRPSGGDDPQR